MALARWQSTIVDDAGNIEASASVEVRDAITNALATLYSDRAGTVGISNPMTADSEGFAAFHVADGVYRITATTATGTRVWNYVPISLVSEAVTGTTGLALLAAATAADALDELGAAAASAVADRTALKALNTVNTTVAYDKSTDQLFRFDSSDLSSTIAPDVNTSTAVSSSADTITKTSHGWKTGYAVYPTTTVNGLTAETVYYVIALYSLPYDAQSADFMVGATLTGGTSGATAIIVADTDGGTTGTLTVAMIKGWFVDNETITDDNGSPGSATSNGIATLDTDTFQLATSFLNAKAGTAVDLTGTTNFTLNRFIDPREILYAIPSAAAKDGSEGAWVAGDGIGMPIRDLWAGAAKDATTDDTAALQACIDLAEALGGGLGGTVIVTGGNSKTTYPLVMRRHVSLWGFGSLRSIISPDDCNGVEYFFTTGFGNSVIQAISFEGTTGTTHIGIYQPGTLDDADELYGLTYKDTTVRGFNIAMKLRTVRDVTIDNCWFQNVNSGIHLVGKCLVIRIFGNTRTTIGSGNGSGQQSGVFCDKFDYTGGTGVIRPETVIIDGVTFYGHTRAVAFEQVIYATVKNCDIMGTGEAIRVNGSLAHVLITIADNYIQANGTSSSAAIRLVQQASVLNSKTIITRNNISTYNGAASTTVGVLAGVSGVGGNVDNVDITHNNFDGNTAYDISVYASGNVTIAANRCFSTAVSASIAIPSPVSSARPVTVRDNNCYSSLSYTSGDVAAGKILLGPNRISNGSVYIPRGWAETEYAGDPNGNLTVFFRGQECFDTTNGKFYKGITAGANSWAGPL